MEAENAPIKDLGGCKIRPLIAGDSAYPLSTLLIKPYMDKGNLPMGERKFSVRLSTLHCVVEQGFGMLKGRWRIVMKKIEQKVLNVNKATIALSQDKACTTETGLNYRQSKAAVSTDLLSHAEVVAEFVDANSDQFYKAWKKLELQ